MKLECKTASRICYNLQSGQFLEPLNGPDTPAALLVTRFQERVANIPASLDTSIALLVTVNRVIPFYLAIESLTEKAKWYKRPTVKNLRENVQGDKIFIAVGGLVSNLELNRSFPVASAYGLGSTIPVNLYI